ncbi:SH3 domain-containing protein [Alphaproteobacteria bacterium GH1-50]|uniref:SH3 domain-containing protein n=1 Tax=Kangsaoukella pontilimi TaxID=2691042 RepID=A0A7C9IRR6_9RHOB|nr:SH3 domain-containing protein [Kangsaoukella pontilimi]MXQ07225.1 SH3 domain-containing protein [Kangsaoukella pontilimi]
MTLIRHVLAFLFVVSTAIGVSAQDRSVNVSFPPGMTATTIDGTVSGRDAVLYRVGAEAGQTMSVVLSSDNAATYFNVYAPGRSLGDEALAIGEMSDPINNWSGDLPASGEYTVAVFLFRSAARRGETSNFRLDVSVIGSTGEAVSNDFADGLAGGPDFLQVAVSGGGTLNLRAGPSGGAGIVTRLSNGQNVRNLGCRMTEGRRWCRVATLADPGYEGWAAGDFLIEGTAETTSGAPGMSVGDGEERVQFASGASGAEPRGQLAPGESRRYVLNARSGQNLYVRVAPQGDPMSYQIFNPDQTFLVDQVSSEQEYRSQLWQSGDHVVEVINRTNSVAGYSVIMGIE